MRRVMIVDDEKWIRRGLIQSIAWDQFGLELIGEASDGQEAYDMAVKKKPDLLFLDMRMPGMDGKELIGMLCRDLPNLLTIVVSGYSDFEYTKEAIRHKAFDYLLKPVKKEELASVLEKALAELDRRESERRKAAGGTGEDWLRRLLFQVEDEVGTKTIPPAEFYLPSVWHSGEYAILVGQLDVFRDRTEHTKLLTVIKEQLERNLPFLFGGHWVYEVTAAMDGSHEIILAVCGTRLEQHDLVRLHTLVQNSLKQAESMSFSFGLSFHQAESSMLGKMLSKARKALTSKTLGATGKLLLAGEETVQLSGNYPQEKENAFLWSMQSGNREAAIQEFERLYAVFAADCMTVEHLQWSATLLIHAIEKQLQGKEARLEEICGKKALVFTEMIQYRNDAASVKKVFTDELLPAVLSFYSHSGEKQGEKIVGELMRWIETNYDQQLSLNHIAGSHYMNPDYLSRIFKKTTGKNFVDYLTDVRIHKAKEMMSKSKYKNYEIAQKVGYEDYRYFSQIFKRKVGMTIGEYRAAANQTVLEGERI